MTYEAFLESKRLDAKPVGISVRDSDLPDFLFDFQRAIDKWALRRGRAALFVDCGGGKTPMQLTWSDLVVRKTRKPVLILAPLGVSHQTAEEEGPKFGIEVQLCRKQPAKLEPKIYITNYEKLDHFDPSAFAGVVIDESSILKAFDGKTKAKIIESFHQTPYRLACTATPAPNDHMELGNHAEFLGIMTRAEMLAMFFTHDGGDTSKWRLKGHAQDRFWKWVCSWAVMLRYPSDLGFDDGKFILPALNFHNIVVESDMKSEGYLFPVEAQTLTEQRAARRASLSDRVAECVKLVKGTGEQFLIWCDLNAEQDELARQLGTRCVSIQGSTEEESRLRLMSQWKEGKVQALVSKPSVFGFGLNFQHCHNVAFVGLSHSYEAFYQATRRVWRFGQEKPVNCYIITSEAEGPVVSNIQRKEKDAKKMQDGMLEHMKEVGELQSASRERMKYVTRKSSGADWQLYLGDCVEVVKGLDEGSVDYSIYSPPFASLYTYSNSERDMGNCKDTQAFVEHLAFLTQELFRVMRPGRLMSFHCMNLPTSKVNHGYIGLQDFRGNLIYAFQQAGFIFHSEVVIWKDPVTSMQRTKALGLLYKQLCKDSAMSRQGIPDYLVTMRKPGENDKPVGTGNRHRFAEYVGDDAPQPDEYNGNDERYGISVWQRYASPVWMDINPSDTLQYTTARDEKDERHVCPLQLQVIERGIELWTNPGDVVLSPFAGIGSEGYVAVKKGRRFIGAELKESYYKVAVKNLQEAERQLKQAQIPLFAETEAV